MCGRFTLILDPGDLQDEFDLGGIADDYTPRYNIAPTQPVGVVRDASERKLELFRWGLIPSWAKDISIGSKMINARAETLAEKPSFRTALAKRRNLIPTTGFFEWKTVAGRKAPQFIRLKDHSPFMFAGLWEEWHSPDGGDILSTTIITCAANRLISELHDRMPVILERRNMWKWLDPTLTVEQATQLLLPFDPEQMEFYPVDMRVNSPAFDTPVCVEPLGMLF